MMNGGVGGTQLGVTNIEGEWFGIDLDTRKNDDPINH